SADVMTKAAGKHGAGDRGQQFPLLTARLPLPASCFFIPASRLQLPFTCSPAFEVALDSVKSFHDVFKGIGIAEADVAFGIRSEIHSRCYAYLCLFEDFEGEGIRIISKPARIGKNVEGPGWLNRYPEPDLPQPGNHILPAPIVRFAHFRDIFGDTRVRERRVTCGLCDGICRDKKILHHFLYRADHVLGRYQVSEPPSRHREKLGKAVEDDA